MKTMFKFRWMFLFLVSVFFAGGVVLYHYFDVAKAKIYNEIFEEAKMTICSIADNYKTILLKKLPKDENWYKYLKRHPQLQKHLNDDLSMLALHNIKYIYMLAPYKNKLIFLADGSKSDKAQFGESFEPLRKNEYFSLKPHYFTHKRLKDIWVTFINPIVVDKKIKALIVVDTPLSFLNFIKSILEKLQKYLNILVGFVFVTVLILTVFTYFDERREKEKELALEQLEILNKNLSKKIQEKVNELRQKDVLLMNQSKLVALGEMLNMIAHQWRQPLNALSASAIHLELKMEMTDEIEKDEIIEFIQFVQEEVQRLSATIDDFMNFSRPDEKEEEFYFNDVLNEVIKLIKIQLKNHNINIEFDIHNNLKLNTYKKVVEHILLNLISNARDALDESDVEDKKIKIYTKEGKDFIEVIVYDNGKKIPPDVADRIFEPYFTTKEEGKGTGLGLYMSKKLAREKLGGDLYFENREDGVAFILKLKK